MPFIRVTVVKEQTMVDLNINHIVGFAPAPGRDQKGAYLTMSNADVYHVEDTPRSLRGYILKAEGKLPAPKEETTSIDDGK